MSTPDLERPSSAPGRGGRVLVFESARPRRAERASGEPQAAPSDEDRLLHALELEQQGFIEGAVCALRCLRRDLDPASAPRLFIHTMYWLAALLAVSGEEDEARELAEDGLLLAWEHGAREELDVFDELWRQLGG